MLRHQVEVSTDQAVLLASDYQLLLHRILCQIQLHDHLLQFPKVKGLLVMGYYFVNDEFRHNYFLEGARKDKGLKVSQEFCLQATLGEELENVCEQQLSRIDCETEFYCTLDGN